MRLLVFAAALLAPALAAADPAAHKPGARVSLLGDHLTVALPAAMKLEPRGASIMAAGASIEDETRGELDDGKARFVLLANEMYALAGTDPKARVEADAKSHGYTTPLAALALPPPLVGFASAPAAATTDRDANLIYAAWITSADGSVQLVRFFVNRDGAPQAPAWAALAKAIAATIGPGKRIVTAKAGDRKLSDDLAITVPNGWVTSRQDGPDFTVNHLRKLVLLGQSAPSCGIYIGGHPAPQHKQTESKAKTTTVTGKLFGDKVKWTSWADGKRFWSEAMTKHPSARGRVHVFCSAAAEAGLAELRRMTESLRKS